MVRQHRQSGLTFEKVKCLYYTVLTELSKSCHNYSLREV